MNETEGVALVTEAVARCLELPVDDVGPEASLVDELGLDSLDFVDLVFLLEGSFGVQLQGSELDALTRLDPSSPEVMQGDFLTAAVVDRARPWLPGLATAPDPARVTPADLFSMVTVQSLWFVMKRVLARASA